jgi:hypothetical protein
MTLVQTKPDYRGIVAQNYSFGKYSSCFLNQDQTFEYAFESVDSSVICSDNFYLNHTICYNSRTSQSYFEKENDIEVGLISSSLFYKSGDMTHFFLVMDFVFPELTPLKVYKNKGISLGYTKSSNITFLILYDENGVKTYPLTLDNLPSFFFVSSENDLLVATSNNQYIFLDLLYPQLHVFYFTNQDALSASCTNDYNFYIDRKLYSYEAFSYTNISSSIPLIQRCVFHGGYLYLGGYLPLTNQNKIEKYSLSTTQIVFSYTYPKPIYSPQNDGINKLLVSEYNNNEMIISISRGTGTLDFLTSVSQPEVFIIFPSLNYSLNFTTYGSLYDVSSIGDLILFCGLHDLYILQLLEN